jgi:hypothetical protein
MVSVVTASLGGYDTPKHHVPQSVPCKFVTLKDSDFRSAVTLPRLTAKVPKFMPWLYAPGPWIWLDASFGITSPTFVEEVMGSTAGAPLWQWQHGRDCIYDEAEASTPLPKYAGQPIREQVDHYREAGHPEHWGLWATGMIVYRRRLPDFGSAWWNEVYTWTVQDQLSEPFVLRQLDMRPSPLPYSLWGNPWLHHHPHADGTQ